MNEFIAELNSALEGKEPGDEMDGRSQYLSQQIMKAAGLSGAYRVPLNAGRMGALLERIDGLDFAIKKAKMPDPPPQRSEGKNGRGPKPVEREVGAQPRRRNEIDFVAQRRYSLALRHRQRAIDNWWWREGMWRATFEQCHCGRKHLMIEVRSEGDRIDLMCPMLFWGRMVLAFPTVFPSTEEGMSKFFEPTTRWRYVRQRGSSAIKGEVL